MHCASKYYSNLKLVAERNKNCHLEKKENKLILFLNWKKMIMLPAPLGAKTELVKKVESRKKQAESRLLGKKLFFTRLKTFFRSGSIIS